MLKNKALRVLKEPITNQNVRVLCHSLLFHAPNFPIYRRFHRVLQHCLYVTLSVIWTGCFFIRRKFHQEAVTSPKSPQFLKYDLKGSKGKNLQSRQPRLAAIFEQIELLQRGTLAPLRFDPWKTINMTLDAEDQKRLKVADWIIIAIYFIACMIVGLWVSLTQSAVH